jgi:hypothetical protein
MRGAVAAAFAATVAFAGCASTQGAKLSRADAQVIALGRLGGGTVREGALETERGRLVWSFDVAASGTSDITEVLVDARTGEIVSLETENVEQQRLEKERDTKGAR